MGEGQDTARDEEPLFAGVRFALIPGPVISGELEQKVRVLLYRVFACSPANVWMSGSSSANSRTVVASMSPSIPGRGESMTCEN